MPNSYDEFVRFCEETKDRLGNLSFAIMHPETAIEVFNLTVEQQASLEKHGQLLVGETMIQFVNAQQLGEQVKAKL